MAQNFARFAHNYCVSRVGSVGGAVKFVRFNAQRFLPSCLSLQKASWEINLLSTMIHHFSTTFDRTFRLLGRLRGRWTLQKQMSKDHSHLVLFASARHYLHLQLIFTVILHADDVVDIKDTTTSMKDVVPAETADNCF